MQRTKPSGSDTSERWASESTARAGHNKQHRVDGAREDIRIAAVVGGSRHVGSIQGHESERVLANTQHVRLRRLQHQPGHSDRRERQSHHWLLHSTKSSHEFGADVAARAASRVVENHRPVDVGVEASRARDRHRDLDRQSWQFADHFSDQSARGCSIRRSHKSVCQQRVVVVVRKIMILIDQEESRRRHNPMCLKKEITTRFIGIF